MEHWPDSPPGSEPRAAAARAAPSGLKATWLTDIRSPSSAASARPVLGTVFDLATTGAPASSVLGLGILALTDITPAFDLTSIGMPGCELHQTLDLVTQFAITAGTGTTPISLPATPALIGTVLHSQSATFSPGINAFGFTTSNGLLLTTNIH